MYILITVYMYIYKYWLVNLSWMDVPKPCRVNNEASAEQCPMAYAHVAAMLAFSEASCGGILRIVECFWKYFIQKSMDFLLEIRNWNFTSISHFFIEGKLFFRGKKKHEKKTSLSKKRLRRSPTSWILCLGLRGWTWFLQGKNQTSRWAWFGKLMIFRMLFQ